jgi:hypothetical protein
MYVLQKLNRFVIPRTELTYPWHGRSTRWRKS